MIFFLLNEKRLADFVMENGRSFHLLVSSISYQGRPSPPPLFVDQTESPLPYLRVWMISPTPAPTLSEGLDQLLNREQ